MNADDLKLSAALLSPTVDPSLAGFATTRDLEPLTGAIGQERALEALDFGLRMRGPGFHLYVAGPVGTGKSTLVHQMVKRFAQDGAAPPDWCYVNNFQDPSRPIALAFPAGEGRAFEREMASFIESLREDIPAAFESKRYLDAKSKLGEETAAKRQELFRGLTERGLAQGYAFEETPVGFSLVPLKDGRPLTEEELEEASEEERRALTERRRTLEDEVREFQVQLHSLSKEAGRRLRELDTRLVRNAIAGRYESLRRAYQRWDAAAAYLERVHDDVVENYRDFLAREAPPLPIPGLEPRQADRTRYRVNLVVQHEPAAGVPVVDEPHPTYVNLIGKIERRGHLGVMYTDFTEIRAGAALQASGGYLVVNALDVLRQPFAWDALKRVIKSGAVTIEDPSEYYGFATAGIRPSPIPVDVKVVMIGPAALYHLLQAYEEDFAKLFKVKADFETDVPRGEGDDRRYAQFVATICRAEDLPHFDAGAAAEFIRQGHRLAERRDRLSLRFSLLSDLIRESAYWAKREGRAVVSREDVERAVAQKRRRSNLIESWIQDEIVEGTLMVDLDGEIVGQVNGLSVHLLGDYAFGRPMRITARTYVGTKGVIDVQREADLAGTVHRKGVLTLAGYLAGKFAGARPFAMCASLTFEQTYSEVEGDSAAVAELAAIVSSLADLPIRQSLAVTGSVNQLGEVQPIGGVNEKIEGFFDSCARRGLTGRQGVVIPARNRTSLVLRRDVVEAVAAGRFAVYAVNQIEEALEILTGVPAGARGPDGAYPPDSVFGRASARLATMAEAMAEWSEGEGAEAPSIIEGP